MATVVAAAYAFHNLDPADKLVLDLAYHGHDPDETTRERLLADPLAQDYAGRVLARWRGEHVPAGHVTDGGYRG